jgi:hypothetical protein
VNLLLDTNVLSEVQRRAPDKVVGWLDAVDEDRVFISVASIAELRRGVALMDDGAGGPRWPPGSPTICQHVSPSGSCRSISRWPSAGAT